jgi:hypothetical protein
MNRLMLTVVVGVVSFAEIAAGQGLGGNAENSPQRGSRGAEGSRLISDPADDERQLQELRERFAQLEKQIQQPLPERELTIKHTPSQKVPLHRPDPKLLENRFRATIEFTPGGFDPTAQDARREFVARMQSGRRDGIWSDPPSEVQRQLNLAISQLGEPLQIGHSSSFGQDSRKTMKWTDYFQVLKDLCPANHRPNAAVLDFLTSESVDRDVNSPGFRGFSFDGQFRLSMVFTVDAPTAELAIGRVRGIAQLLDGGMSRPVQTYLFARGKESLADAEQRLAELAKVSEAIGAEEKFLTKPSEISPEILTQLKSQRVMIAVEEAGLTARVKACDAMLADNRKLEISTLQSVGDMKVKAEIERIGLKEKLDQINKFISEGDERDRRQNQVQTLGAKRRAERGHLRSAMSRASGFADLVELFAPFQVSANEITITPIEWTAADGQ